MKNNTTLKIPKKYQGRIDEIDRENCDDSESNFAYVIALKDGWCAGDNYGVHSLIEYNQKDALDRLRNTIKCDCCKECKTVN